jgi:glycosyltransferase involved in cell wall biosynthesis
VIDIVIPAYRGGPLLRRALASVYAQSSGEWRLHLVDDASTGSDVRDALGDVRDSRVSYSRNAGNIGINAQFNRALTLGTSAHVVIMGEDDEMLPGYVAQVTETLDRFPSVAVVQPGVEVIDAEGEVVFPLTDRVKRLLAHKPPVATSYGGEELLVSLLRGNWCYFPSLCWRRDVAGAIGFPPEYEVVQDLALLVEVLRRGHELVVDPRPAFRYRRHDASLSSERALDARRFAEERAYFVSVSRSLAASGMPSAARAARWHLTSRLHAAARMPEAIRSRNPAAMRALLRHLGR